MQYVSAALLLIVAGPVSAAEIQVHRDLGYAEPKNERQLLDVYAPAGGEPHPVAEQYDQAQRSGQMVVFVRDNDNRRLASYLIDCE